MTNQDSRDFFTRLLGLSELFDAKFSEAKAALYFEALKDLPLPVVIGALGQAVKACTFMPRPAELRALALGDDESQTERAWVAFREAMRIAGAYASVLVRDPALASTILAIAGDWPRACTQELTAEMWASKRKEFGRVYRVMAQRKLDGARYLPGHAEQTNAGRRDWLKFVPVYEISGQEACRSLTLPEAEQARLSMAVERHELSRLTDAIESGLKLVPKALEEAR